MTPGKRAMDIGLALAASVVLAVPFAILCVAVLAVQGRPLFYPAERMRAPGQAFTLWKLRTMTAAAADAGVSGGDKAGRITPFGRWLRRFRIDEVPQLWNILRGDMSFVGPRPPLRAYVERFPEIYGRVLRSPPGVTGLATLTLHRWEERVLSACRTAAETDAAYVRRAIPRKARLDLIYQRHASLGFDLRLIGRTVLRLLRPQRPR